MRRTKVLVGITFACLTLCAQADQTTGAASATKTVDLTPKTDGFEAIFAQWAQESAQGKAPTNTYAVQKK